MDEKERQWILENVETINADTNDIDELCCALEHSTIFAVEYIQNFATNLINLDFKNKDLQQRINEAVKWCECVVNAKYTADKLPNGKITDMGYCLDLAEPLLKILKGDDTNE